MQISTKVATVEKLNKFTMHKDLQTAKHAKQSRLIKLKNKKDAKKISQFGLLMMGYAI